MATREGILDYLDDRYYWAYVYYQSAKTKLFNAYTGYEVDSDHDVLGYLVDGCRDLYIAVGQLTTKADPIGGRAQIAYFLRYFTIDEAPEPVEYELTWKKICEAWVKDDFEGKEWTIAIIDHMRKLMWDEPFRILWASKPEKEWD